MVDETPVPEIPTIPRVKELVGKYVENMGEDYIYPHHICAYIDRIERKPSCIIGHVLADMNVPIQSMIYVNEHGVLSALNSIYGEDVVDEDTKKYMHRLQYLQDNYVPWGTAVKVAEELTSILEITDWLTKNGYDK